MIITRSPLRISLGGGGTEGVEQLRRAVCVAGEVGMAVGAGVELHDLRADGLGHGDLHRTCLQEQGDAHAGVAQAASE